MFLVVMIHVFVCIMLILIVLLQSGRSGMGAVFGGSSGTVFGTSGGNILAKFTAYIAVIFMVTSVGLTMYATKQYRASVIPEVKKGVEPKDLLQEVPRKEGEKQEPGTATETPK